MSEEKGSYAPTHCFFWPHDQDRLVYSEIARTSASYRSASESMVQEAAMVASESMVKDTVMVASESMVHEAAMVASEEHIVMVGGLG